MEILCLDQFSTLGGGQQCFLALVPAFHSKGWRVRAVIPGEGPYEHKLRGRGCEVQTFASTRISNKHKPVWELPRYVLKLSPITRALTRQIRLKKPDLLYVNGPRFLPAAAWVAQRHQIPLVFHAHNRLLQKAAIAVCGISLSTSRASVIACCRYAAEPLTGFVPSERIQIVYNGTENLRPVEYIRSRAIQNIGVVGRVAPEKGQLEFVHAATLLEQVTPAARFFVIGGAASTSGDSYHERVVRESRGLPVSFEGWKDDPALTMKGLDLLVVPSQAYDAAPRVILEAFSAGIPVVAYRSGGIPELIEDNVTGFLVEERTPAALASRIFQVLSMSDFDADRVVENARRAWKVRFHIDHYREAVCEAVESLAGLPLKSAVA